MLLIDTRDKPDKIKHITDYLDRHKIPYDRTKLYIGDYQRADNPLVLIDRKQNLLEMANNATQGHERFKRELERLTAINGKMYILIEENLNSHIQSCKEGHFIKLCFPGSTDTILSLFSAIKTEQQKRYWNYWR